MKRSREPAAGNGDRSAIVLGREEAPADDFWNERGRRKYNEGSRRRQEAKRAANPGRAGPAAWPDEELSPRGREPLPEATPQLRKIEANRAPSERLLSTDREATPRPDDESERRPYAIRGGLGRLGDAGGAEPPAPNKPPAPPPPPGQSQTLGQWFKEITILGIVAVGTAVLLTTYVVQAFFIPSESMENTLLISDRVLVNKISYNFWEPRRGDIVVFASPEGEPAPPPANTPFARFMDKVVIAIGLKSSNQDLIKRVVATGGQTIEARLGLVFVDGQQLDEPYVKTSDQPISDFAPVTVPEGHVFVMGDNRLDSRDSRTFGPIPQSEVIGKAFARVWPLERVAWFEL